MTAYQQGRRAVVDHLISHHDNPFLPFNGFNYREWERGYLDAARNPVAEPGWMHVPRCVCGVCDGRGGYVTPGDTPGHIPEWAKK